MMRVQWLFLGVVSYQLTACTTVQPAAPMLASLQSPALNPATSSGAATMLPEAELDLRSQELVVSQAEELAQAERKDEEEFHAELKFADHAEREAVQRWIRYFTENDRARFQRFLTRGLTYKPLIETILKKEGVPTYFYYLAMIESGFQVQAKSHAQAVGMWQFIKATGQRYGLQVNSYVDERQDPIRATIAAAHYLKGLHNVFQSWFLAMSAYNAGESRIMGSIMRNGSRDFWQLAKMRALPPETRNYVPKFIAAALIGAHPEQYGFELPEVTPLPSLFATSVPSPVSLTSIAQALSIPLATLRRYNPGLLGRVTPPHNRSYRIWLPFSSKGREGALAKLRPLPSKTLLAQSGSAPASYVVRRGDTLARLAQRFGSSVAGLRSANRLRSNRIITGMRLKIPSTASKPYRQYRVKSGDNLYELANRFGMSLTKLKKLNALRHSRIYVGQVLKVGSNRS